MLVASLASAKLPPGQTLEVVDDSRVRAIVLSWSSGYPRVDDPERWEPPAQIDEYRVERLVGSGAMGHVYRGYDTHLERAVAIKVLAAREPDAAAYERFLIEARALARLHHPNVVTCYRVGEVAGRPYLISEFINGIGLEKTSKPVSWKQALAIGLDLARGLEAAHAHGVLHRDIKPANVVVSEAEGAKLLDFGLAKLTPKPSEQSSSPEISSALGVASETLAHDPRGDNECPPTGGAPPVAASAVVGTPLYMAPELWRREAATTRSDVYSLGALLYELCSGHPPHEAPSIKELGAAVMHKKPRTLDSLNLRINSRFAAVIEQCLQLDPSARFASGAELRRALEQVSTASRSRFVPSMPAGLVMILLVAVISGALALLLNAKRSTRPSPPPHFRVELVTLSTTGVRGGGSDRGITLSVTGLPPDAVDLRVKLEIDGNRQIERQRVTGSQCTLSLPLPKSSRAETLRLEIVVYDQRASIAVAHGTSEWKQDDPRVLSGQFELCTNGWCAEHPPVGHRHLAVWGMSEDEVWLVGENAPIQKYDGLSWIDETPGKSHHLVTLWGFDSNDLWAVGGCGNPEKHCPYNKGERANVVLRRDHGRWKTETTSSPEFGQFLSVWASGRNDVWAVGCQGPTRHTTGFYAHNDGTGWKEVPGGPKLGSSLNGVWGTVRDDVWLIGETNGNARIWHHTGGSKSEWVPVELPKTRFPLVSLWSIWGTGRRNAWTVGSHGNILHWDGSRWQGACTTFGDNPPPDLQNLWVDTADKLWAVGDTGNLLRWQPRKECWAGVDLSVPFCDKKTATLWGIWSRDNDAWATGGCGLVLHYRAG